MPRTPTLHWRACTVHTACCNGLSIESTDLCTPTPAHPTSTHFRNWPGRMGTVCSHGIPQTGFREPALWLIPAKAHHENGPRDTGKQRRLPQPCPPCQWAPGPISAVHAETGHLSKRPGQGRVLELRTFWKASQDTLWGHPLVTAPAEPLGMRAGWSQTQLPTGVSVG